jgi:DNA-binding CsgD family transcriptional regulator
MREAPITPLSSFAALIVQDQIYRSRDWVQRVAAVSDDFVLVRFPDRINSLVQCCSRFENSIALIEQTMFELVTSEILTGLSRSACSVRLIARVDGTESADQLAGLLLRGCHGFVSDRISAASLRRVLAGVRRGEIVATRKVLSRALYGVLEGRSSPKLSPRETEVMNLLGQRLSNKIIAQQLFISEETLRWHLRNLYGKTGLETRGDLIEYAATNLRRPRSAAAALAWDGTARCAVAAG